MGSSTKCPDFFLKWQGQFSWEPSRDVFKQNGIPNDPSDTPSSILSTLKLLTLILTGFNLLTHYHTMPHFDALKI